MKYAQEKYNVPLLLDPKDLVENPEESSIITYINGFLKYEDTKDIGYIFNEEDLIVNITGKDLQDGANEVIIMEKHQP